MKINPNSINKIDYHYLNQKPNSQQEKKKEKEEKEKETNKQTKDVVDILLRNAVDFEEKKEGIEDDKDCVEFLETMIVSLKSVLNLFQKIKEFVEKDLEREKVLNLKEEVEWIIDKTKFNKIKLLDKEEVVYKTTLPNKENQEFSTISLQGLFEGLKFENYNSALIEHINNIIKEIDVIINEKERQLSLVKTEVNLNNNSGIFDRNEVASVITNITKERILLNKERFLKAKIKQDRKIILSLLFD